VAILIITHGNRTIRRELGDKPTIVGRDPGCDLFFADKRLSRQHARFEATETGVRLVDLESRNGTWVNQTRIKEVILTPDDTIRIGSLTISLEAAERAAAPPPVPSEIPITAELAEEPLELIEDEDEDEGDDEESKATPPAPAPEQAGTVMLSKAEVEGLPVPPTTPMPRPTDHALAPAPAKGDAEDDAGTVMLSKSPTGESPDETMMPATAMLPQDLLSQTKERPAPSMPEVGMPTPPEVATKEQGGATPAEGPAGRIASWSWSFKLLLLALGLGFTVYFIVAWPLVRTLGSELREESLRRGRVLLNLLAATNSTLVGQERVRDLSVEIVEREQRVKEAYLLNFDGNVLAPSAQSDKTMETIPGIDVPTKDIRTFYLGRRSGRDYVMVQPLVYRGSRVGVAVLVYEAAAGAGGWTTAILFLGLIVLLAAVGAVVVLGKKMTLAPMASIRDDVEAVVKGDSEYLPKEQAFQELSDLAESINRLIDRAPGLRSPPATKPRPPADWPVSAPSVAHAPEIPPTAVAGDSEPSPELATPPPVSSAAPVPSASYSGGGGEGARFWVDESFVVIRAEEAAYEVVGTAPGEMEGKHLIEAIKEQRVLEVVLDTINNLQGEPTAQGQVDLETGSIRVTAIREATSVVVSIEKL